MTRPEVPSIKWTAEGATARKVQVDRAASAERSNCQGRAGPLRHLKFRHFEGKLRHLTG